MKNNNIDKSVIPAERVFECMQESKTVSRLINSRENKNVIPAERVFECMQESKIYSKLQMGLFHKFNKHISSHTERSEVSKSITNLRYNRFFTSFRMTTYKKCYQYLFSIALLFTFFTLSSLASAAQSYITIDTVYKFTPGTGQNVGQDPMYYPNNIFGKPYSKADSLVPASSPEDLCSLGMNGEIIVGFKNYSIIDRDGVDFIIYENVMRNPILNRYFVEPAKVSVSNDGVNWTEFPFDSLTLDGCAGTKPTISANLDIDILQSGGNGFDLAQIGLTEIKYIKITDVCEIIKNNKKHPFYDVTISGFDLEALVGVNFKDNSITSIEENSQKIRNFVNIKEIIANTSGQYEVYSISGERIFFGNGDELNKFDTQLNSGVYMIVNRNLNNIDIYKIIK